VASGIDDIIVQTVLNARHARCNFQVALLTSERQLSSLTYNLNLNLNQKIKKIKKSLPNHVPIQTELEDYLNDFKKTLPIYQSSCKTILSHLYLYIQIPDEKSSMVYLERVSLRLLILPMYYKESESLTPDSFVDEIKNAGTDKAFKKPCI
jgi:hypothetical protein